MAAPIEFELDGKQFRVERLKVKASLAGLRLVGKVLLPAIGEAVNAPEGQIGNAISKVVEGLDCLPELLDLFAASTKVPNPIGGGSWVSLVTFLDDVFGGRPDLVVEFLVRCVEQEYGTFLKGDGPLAGLLAKATAKAV